MFDNGISKFLNSDLTEKEIEKTYNEKLLQIKDDDLFKNSKMEFLKTEKKKEAKSRSYTSNTTKTTTKKDIKRKQ